MGYGHKYADVIANAEHYKALGQTTVYIDDENPPWHLATGIAEGSTFRLSGPTGLRVEAVHDGLTLSWSLEFEGRGANGRGVSMFDRDRLRAISMKLPARLRSAFAVFLAEKVLPGLEQNTAEIREALGKQLDSEDCVRGLIAFAKASA